MLGCLLLGCSRSSSDSLQGYIEGEYVYAASPLAGTLAKLATSRGAEVKAGDLLFELEHEAELAALREAEQRLAQAKARLDNLNKGRRPTEIDSIQAQLDRAKANLRLSMLELERRQKLIDSKVISEAELDTAKAGRDADQAAVMSLTADLETAKLGARQDEINAAEADTRASMAVLAKARWAVEKKTQVAPTNAFVHDTLYRVGEYVAAGNPVVVLLPPGNLKVRFFVPQPALALIKPGQEAAVTLDGLTSPLRAVITYISTQAEFTPPVIYNKENRAKLVFMVEAVFAPENARVLKPGQPVDVKLNP